MRISLKTKSFRPEFRPGVSTKAERHTHILSPDESRKKKRSSANENVQHLLRNSDNMLKSWPEDRVISSTETIEWSSSTPFITAAVWHWQSQTCVYVFHLRNCATGFSENFNGMFAGFYRRNRTRSNLEHTFNSALYISNQMDRMSAESVDQLKVVIYRRLVIRPNVKWRPIWTPGLPPTWKFPQTVEKTKFF